METRLQVSGPVSADLAWERYACPARWPMWAPHMTSVRVDGDRIRPGMKGTVSAARVVRARFRVTEVDEAAKTWAWRVRVGPVRLRLRHEVVATDTGCATSLTISGPAPVVTPYLSIAGWALRRLVTLPPGRA